LQKPRRPDAEIFFPKQPLEAHFFPSERGAIADTIAAVDQAKDGLQLVIAVRSKGEHVQEKIQLSRRRVPGHFHRDDDEPQLDSG